ncbi:MAG: hypothetical protein KDA05_03510 [Phycisphaerales bacterium]|nr:hypothetical protein [Phycisphaerales bacterium]
MALFGRKKSGGVEAEADAAKGAAGDGSGVDEPFKADPDKAARFFAHAKTVHETTNFEYAMRLWLDGLRHDPTDLSGVTRFFQSAASFLGQPKAKASKETAGAFKGKEPVERYLRGLLEWGLKPEDSSLAVGAVDGAARLNAADLDLGEVAYWLGERALVAVRSDKKPRKDQALKLMEACSKVGAFDLAVQAGEIAVKMDPTDGDLATRVRNFSAQAAMSRGGFEQGGDFRRNIKDAEAQRRMEEEQRIVKTEDTKERLLKAAEEDYRLRPTDVPAINKYARALREMGDEANERKAMNLYAKAYEDTKQFRFREEAGELRLRLARRALRRYRDAAEANPGDEAAAKQARQAEIKFREMEIEESKLKVENYPTDLTKKFELGSRLFELARLRQSDDADAAKGLYEQVIPLLQEAKSDPRARSAASNYLGQAFAAIGWNDEAIDTFRGAIEHHDDPTNERGMELRYGLMLSLKGKAASGGGPTAIAACEEAEKLASAIAIQQFNYRDIRDQREALKKRLEELRAGG